MLIILLFSDCNMIADGKYMQQGLKTEAASGCLSKCLGLVIKAFAVKTVKPISKSIFVYVFHLCHMTLELRINEKVEDA